MMLDIFSSMLYNTRKQFDLPFDSSMITRDQEYARVVESDPRESRVATSGLLVRTLLQQLRARSAAKKIRVPVLFLLAGKDLFADNKESRAVFKKLASPDRTAIEYPEMLHNLAIDIGKEKVFSDTLAWLDKRV
jgi:alpha-beta hydrolase superfamily lysophospholipase